MPTKSWANFEDIVRRFASQIWGTEAGPERIAGVALDCVLRVNAELAILVEVTEERDLGKVREDVGKLITVKNHLFHQDYVFARCFCVVNAENVTHSMMEAGAAQVSAHLPLLTACSLPGRKALDVTTVATIQASGDRASRPRRPVA